MAGKTYDVKAHTLNFAGIDLGRDTADPFISVEASEDAWTTKTGLDGQVTRSRNRVDYIALKAKFLYTSPDNDLLMAIHLADINIEGGIMSPLLARDRLGTMLLASPEAWIVKAPDFEVGKEVGEVEWEIHAANPQRFQGGH
jgi:hypothetical protein